MRRLAWIATPLLLAGVLSACTLTITYSPPPNASPVTANVDDTTPVVQNKDLAAGSTVYYEVSLPASVRSYPVVYFELTSNLNLSLISASSYKTLASSSDRSYFASGTIGLNALAVAGSPSPQSVVLPRTCAGSCIIWPTAASTYYVGVENNTGASVNFDMYAYGFDFQDSTEPNNDNISTAPVLGTGDTGAIETLGDVDYWRATQSGNLIFSATDPGSPVALQAEIVDANGNHVAGPYNPTTTPFAIYTGEYVKIISVNGYAGPAGSSGYGMTYQ